MARIALTNGNWAEMIDPETCTNDQFDALAGVLMDIFEEMESVEGEDKPKARVRNALFNRARIAHMVTAWSLEEPLPSEDPDVLGRILHRDFQALHLGAVEAEKALVTYEPPDAANPGERPTSPSRRSKPTLRAAL